MGTKSYVKPICDPRVLSHLSVGLCVNTNEIQSPCAKEVKIVGRSKEIEKITKECEKIRKEREKTLSEKDKKLADEILENSDDSYDDH